jgi:predicted amidohydrolase
MVSARQRVRDGGKGESMHIRAAGAQIPITPDISANVAAIERAIAYAASVRADILLTPEGSLSGYTHEFDRRAVALALQHVTGAAAGARVGLALGTCFVEPEDGRCYNQVRFYRPDGAYLGFHSKTLTCGSLADPPRGEIEHYAVAPLRTFDVCGVTAGALICNDLWANPGCTPQDDPHLTHRLARLGARVIFHAVNGGRGGPDGELCWRYHESNLLMRAGASRIWIVTADNCFPTDMPCSAPSGVVSPEGRWAVRAPDRGEQFYVFDVTLPE